MLEQNKRLILNFNLLQLIALRNAISLFHVFCMDHQSVRMLTFFLHSTVSFRIRLSARYHVFNQLHRHTGRFYTILFKTSQLQTLKHQTEMHFQPTPLANISFFSLLVRASC